MTALVFFALGCWMAWHGFTVGSMTGFMWIMGAVVVWLMSVAAMGMSAPQRVSRNPPPLTRPVR